MLLIYADIGRLTKLSIPSAKNVILKFINEKSIRNKKERCFSGCIRMDDGTMLKRIINNRRGLNYI